MTFDITSIQHIAFVFALVFLSIAVIFVLVRAFMGPRFTDSLLAINVINTIVNVLICLVAVVVDDGAFVDLALVYSMIGFLSVVVLSRLYLQDYLKKQEKIKGGESQDGNH